MPGEVHVRVFGYSLCSLSSCAMANFQDSQAGTENGLRTLLRSQTQARGGVLFFFA